MAKHQFTGTSHPRTFFDRRVHHVGQGRGISITKFIPKNWEYVRLSKVSANAKSVTIRIEKLLDSEQLAQAAQTNSNSEQDT